MEPERPLTVPGASLDPVLAPEPVKARLERRRIALVLGAGGARGLAHIGVIEVLREHGFEISAIAGSSMGALVGGICAAGRLDDYRDWACALERSGVLRLLDFAFGHPGLIRGERVIGALQELVGNHRIEDLPIPYTAVATDLHRQREVWINRGPLFDAIRASIAIPMIFTPYRIGDRELVDGGLLAPVPIAATRQYDADLVVAVDVNAAHDVSLRAPAEVATPLRPVAISADPTLRARVSGWIDGLLDRGPAVAPAPAQPGLIDLMSRSLDTMQAQLSRLQLALDPPDLLIRVPRDACMFHEFWRAREMIDVGREAAVAALRAAGVDAIRVAGRSEGLNR
jgi:NTE family protein